MVAPPPVTMEARVNNNNNNNNDIFKNVTRKFTRFFSADEVDHGNGAGRFCGPAVVHNQRCGYIPQYFVIDGAMLDVEVRLISCQRCGCVMMMMEV